MSSRPRPCQSPQLLTRRCTSCIPTDGATPNVDVGTTTTTTTTKLLIEQRQPPESQGDGRGIGALLPDPYGLLGRLLGQTVLPVRVVQHRQEEGGVARQWFERIGVPVAARTSSATSGAIVGPALLLLALLLLPSIDAATTTCTTR